MPFPIVWYRPKQSIVAINGPGMDSVDDKLTVTHAIRAGLYLLPFALPALVGCVDGPLYELKKLNPIIQRQWKEDRDRGPVYSQRVDEMRLLASQFPTMEPTKQAEWVNMLSTLVQTETSPEIRREAILALSRVMATPGATEAVMKLSQDKNEKVRLEVAKSLRIQVTPDTTQTLMAMATSDASENVRLSAIRSLGPHRSNEVKQFLANQLNKSNPAFQESAAMALRDHTGKDFKGDVSMWKRYLNGENIEPPTPTLYEAIQPYIPFTR